MLAEDDGAPFFFKSWYLFVGKICFTLVLLLGFWISFGIHISIWPLYVDIHFLWFIFTIQGKSRGEFQKSNDLEWHDCHMEELNSDKIEVPNS